jgi:hypothetical protein
MNDYRGFETRIDGSAQSAFVGHRPLLDNAKRQNETAAMLLVDEIRENVDSA